MNHQEILRKLALLRERDPTFRLFGAASHRYTLRKVINEADLASFEMRHQIRLPDDYRDFLLYCGNGGAGPYYGLFPLGFFDGAGGALEPWQEGDGFAGVLRRPFPHVAAWNLPEARLVPPEEFPDEESEGKWHELVDEEYWAPGLVDGAFPICHQGCAYRNLLIVSGPERGKIWLDGRASDEGLTPVLDQAGNHANFAAWYSKWLEKALEGHHF